MATRRTVWLGLSKHVLQQAAAAILVRPLAHPNGALYDTTCYLQNLTILHRARPQAP